MSRDRDTTVLQIDRGRLVESFRGCVSFGHSMRRLVLKDATLQQRPDPTFGLDAVVKSFQWRPEKQVKKTGRRMG